MPKVWKTFRTRRYDIHSKRFGRFITHVLLLGSDLPVTTRELEARIGSNCQVGEQICRYAGRYVHVPRPGAAFDIRSLRTSKAALEEVTNIIIIQLKNVSYWYIVQGTYPSQSKNVTRWSRNRIHNLANIVNPHPPWEKNHLIHEIQDVATPFSRWGIRGRNPQPFVSTNPEIHGKRTFDPTMAEKTAMILRVRAWVSSGRQKHP